MEFSKGKIRQIRHLMILGALLVLALIYSKEVFQGIAFFFGILSPFLVGGVMAFVLNIPMRAYEEKLFRRWRGKSAAKCKRPLCLVLSIVSVSVVIAIVVGTVVPQVVTTASEIGRKIPAFTDKVLENLDRLMKDYPEVTAKIDELELTEIKWDSVLDSIIDFLKNGAGDVLNSTVSVASGIISGIVNGVISFIFAIYVLSQKERLEDQGRRILTAYLPKAAAARTGEICSLLYKNFSSFITGQCLEAVILGFMFVVTMTLFRMPYALMVGVLIAFTALIPIVGGFIGCWVGVFLILIDNPLQALWFIILFLILQQIEGNLIYPRVVGNSVGLPAIWVLTAVSVGGSLFGISGMLFFIPLTSSFYALLRESVNSRNAGKGLPVAQVEDNGGQGEGRQTAVEKQNSAGKDTGKRTGKKR
nr:AI-2E family transporter [uncultured Acetatifactor sp.]